MSERYPVFISVTRDGRAEQVRVGWAVRSDAGFTLSFDQMTLGAPTATPARASGAPSRSAKAPAGGDGAVFPNYGRSKGQPVAGASLQDLEFYANGCRRTLADPGKARWHDKERVLLAAIEAEIARQRGESPDDDGIPPPTDADAPPPDEEPPF